jgi:hypothetical protein
LIEKKTALLVSVRVGTLQSLHPPVQPDLITQGKPGKGGVIPRTMGKGNTDPPSPHPHTKLVPHGFDRSKILRLLQKNL